MKLRCALVLFLAACACAFGQSASTILASLRIKGATSDGGDPKYENYIPKLDDRGTLPLSFLPELMYTNIYAWVNENGSEADKRAINSILAMLDSKVEMAIRPVYDNITATTNYYHTNLVAHFQEYEKDPLFLQECRGSKIALGELSDAVDDSVQLLQGTNLVQGTLKFKDITVINTNGVIPEETVPWAATYNYVNDTIFTTTSNKVSRTGDTLSGDLTIQNAGMAAAVFDSAESDLVTLYGVMTFDQSNARDAVFSGFYRIGTSTNLPPEFRSGTYVTQCNLSYDESNNIYVSTNTLWDASYTVETSIDVSAENEAEARLRIYTNTVFLAEYSVSGIVENQIDVTEIGATVYRNTRVRNPGISLSDVNEPVNHIDLVSPGGHVFRLRITDYGDIYTTRIR